MICFDFIEPLPYLKDSYRTSKRKTTIKCVLAPEIIVCRPIKVIPQNFETSYKVGMRLRVLGIDPGSIKTGFSIVDGEDRKLKYISSGTILLDETQDISLRLVQLYQDIVSLIEKYKPDHLALESLFFAQNAQSALKLGHARGVILMAAASAGMKIYEYTPTEVKASIVGAGRAQKDQVARMIKLLLKFPKEFEFSTSDQSDALAIALTHVQTWELKDLNNNRDRSTHRQDRI